MARKTDEGGVLREVCGLWHAQTHQISLKAAWHFTLRLLLSRLTKSSVSNTYHSGKIRGVLMMMTTKNLTEVSKGVLGGLCSFPKTLVFLTAIAFSTSVSSLALAQILIDYDDGDALNGIHDASILNGGFEDVLVTAGSAGDRLQYDEVPNWTNVGGADQTFDFIRTNIELSSDQNAVISDSPDRQAGINTGHSISLGDVFDYSYFWRDASAWNDAGDQVGFRFFTTLDDTIGGSVVNEYEFLSGTSTSKCDL